MDPIEKMNRYVENHPYVFYTILIVVMLGMNIFYRYRQGEDWADILVFSFLNTAILSAAVIYGDRKRRKNLVNKQKIDECLKK